MILSVLSKAAKLFHLELWFTLDHNSNSRMLLDVKMAGNFSAGIRCVSRVVKYFAADRTRMAEKAYLQVASYSADLLKYTQTKSCSRSQPTQPHERSRTIKDSLALFYVKWAFTVVASCVWVDATLCSYLF